MFPYLTSVKNFIKDSENPVSFSDTLEKRVNFSNWKKSAAVSNSEKTSWINSVCTYMRDVLIQCDPELAIGLEYCTERGENPHRVDMMIAGYNQDNKPCLIIVELKQWSYVEKGQKKDSCLPKLYDEKTKTYKPFGDELKIPALTLCEIISQIKKHNNFFDKIKITPVIYAHNMEKENDHLDLAKGCDSTIVFYKDQSDKFIELIKNTFSNEKKYKDHKQVFSELRNGYEFIALDNIAGIFTEKEDGKDVPEPYEKMESYLRPDQSYILKELQDHILSREKHIDIIYGGPGSGKTLIAMMIRRWIRIYNDSQTDEGNKFRCMLIYEGSAPANKIRDKIDELGAKRIGYYHASEMWNKANGSDKFNCMIFDEFHRYQIRKTNEMEETIREIDGTVVLLLDEKQELSESDAGAKYLKDNLLTLEQLFSDRKINSYSLRSQFRCNQDDGYVFWVEQKLRMNDLDFIRREDLDFEPEIVDRTEVERIIQEAKKGNDWLVMSTKKKNIEDLSIDYFKGKHGLVSPGGEAAQWFDVQGIEYENVLVIIGDDLKFSDLNNDRKINEKQKYRMLLTRGLKKCAVYCKDDLLRQHFLKD